MLPRLLAYGGGHYIPGTEYLGHKRVKPRALIGLFSTTASVFLGCGRRHEKNNRRPLRTYTRLDDHHSCTDKRRNVDWTVTNDQGWIALQLETSASRRMVSYSSKSLELTINK
jgi:hypothetical protein